jgi:hypothetical protein
MLSIRVFTMPTHRALLCCLALWALAACQKESAPTLPPRVAAAAASTGASERSAAEAHQDASTPLRPLPGALSPTLGADWNAVRAGQIAINAIERLTTWPALGLCESACRIDARELAQGEERGLDGERHLVVLSINGGEEDGSGPMFQGTAIGVCTFDRRAGSWTLTDCQEDAARLQRGYGEYTQLKAHVHTDAAMGTSIVVDSADMATGEEYRYLTLLRRVGGRFTDVLDLKTGEDTHGNYQEHPDIETAWTTAFAYQDASTPTPDIVATATGHRGLAGIDCKARFRFDRNRYHIAEINGSSAACPWRSDATTSTSTASSSATSATDSTVSPASGPAVRALIKAGEDGR